MSRSVSGRLDRPAVVFALCVFATSCGDSGPKLYPVRGKVLYEDKLAAGAQVVFAPKGGDTAALRPTGIAGADGTFTLSAHPHGEGAPAGEYTVIVTWFPPNAREIENARSKLPTRYSDESQTPLKATVKEGSNELDPFKLTK